MESIVTGIQPEDDRYCNWDSWPFELFDDMDVVTFLYSDFYLTKENPYHFEHWREAQFFCAS